MPVLERQRASRALNVVDRHQHIGIGDDHPIVARRLPSLDDIVEFGVGADPVIADQQARRALGIGRDRVAHQGCDRIIAAGEAEDDLIAWIVEREDRPQRFARERLDAAQRLHDCDARSILRRRQRAARPSPAPPVASATLSPCIPALVAQIPAARAPIVMGPDYPNHKALSHHIAAPARRFYEGEWPLFRWSGSRLRRPAASISATPAPLC